MSHPHEHPQEVQPKEPRRIDANRLIVHLNERLDVRANEIRQLEDRLVYFQTLADDLTAESDGRLAMLSQVAAENTLLRKRLGLAPDAPVELTDDEVAELPEGATIIELPDPPEEQATPEESAETPSVTLVEVEKDDPDQAG